MDPSESVILLAQQNEELMEQQQAFREIIKQLTKENTALREENIALSVENASYLDLLQQQNQDKNNRQSAAEGDESTEDIEELKRTIDALQERVIGLVQEKFSMQIFIEELEHELAMISPHTIPRPMPIRKLDYKSISSELAPGDNDGENECLETARRQQQEQLLFDDANVSGGQQVVGEKSSIAMLGDFDIRKELEEQFHKRTTTVRPSEGYERSRSYPTSPESDQGVAIRRFIRGGKNETSSQLIQEAKEGNEKSQRSRLWIGRIGFKGAQHQSAPSVVNPVQRGLGHRRKASNAVMMIEGDDEVIEHFNNRRESEFPNVNVNLNRDESGPNLPESITNMNLVL